MEPLPREPLQLYAAISQMHFQSKTSDIERRTKLRSGACARIISGAAKLPCTMLIAADDAPEAVAATVMKAVTTSAMTGVEVHSEAGEIH